MNILRKKRKKHIKIRLKRIILLIFSLIMTTFAWITYTKILNTGVNIDIISWDISFFVDENGNNIAEEEEERENPIAVDLSDLYPGMEEKVVKVIMKNNGQTPTDILYTTSEINILGNTYTIQENVPEGNEYYILKHNPVMENGITTADFINEPERFPFKIVIEHSQEVLSGGEGYLTIKVTWPLYNEDDSEEEKNRKDELDTEWGYKVAKYLSDNADNPDVTGAFHVQIRINAIGKPRTDYDESFTAAIMPSNYGDYVNYPIDLNGDNNYTNDWKVFYNNGNNVYLIAADYLQNNLIEDGVMAKSALENYATYGTYFDMSNLNITSISSGIINNYLLKKAIPTENNNYKATATLLEQNNWDNLLNSSYAESVVGSPTVEMFINSWNQKFAQNDDYSVLNYEWDKVTNNGYKIGEGEANSTNVTLKGYSQESANLYFPHPDITDNLNGTNTSDCSGYWLSSPSSSGINKLIYVRANGMLESADIDNQELCIRPVICLNTGIIATQNDNVWELAEN